MSCPDEPPGIYDAKHQYIISLLNNLWFEAELLMVAFLISICIFETDLLMKLCSKGTEQSLGYFQYITNMIFFVF